MVSPFSLAFFSTLVWFRDTQRSENAQIFAHVVAFVFTTLPVAVISLVGRFRVFQFIFV